mgnify:CR=1 FL=1
MSIRTKKPSRNSFSVSLIAVILFTASATVFPPDTAVGQEKPRRFTFSGNSTSISFSGDDRYTVLSGNARITSEDLVIRAEEIELSGEDFRYARCRDGAPAQPGLAG